MFVEDPWAPERGGFEPLLRRFAGARDSSLQPPAAGEELGEGPLLPGGRPCRATHS
jgi:hypothetical protein